MGLERYNKKRDFAITPEPRGGARKSRDRYLRFVVQKHAASHLHYDFRLELGGVLLSWAVPKGPSLDPADKRLAMQTEDHPIEYGDFEGIIPAKQYGGGTVLLWDRGIWTPEGNAASAYHQGMLKFSLNGEKLAGRWMLVRTRKDEDSEKKSWLLVKEKDGFARPGSRVVEEYPASVVSERTIEQIAADANRIWHSKKTAKENIRAGAVFGGAEIELAKLKGARKAPMQETLAPALATLVDAAPDGDDWLHEMKYDGYRMLCRIENSEVSMFSRNGLDWSSKFPILLETLAELPLASAWLDGEVAVMGNDGRTSFSGLKDALSRETEDALLYFVFDLPYLNGYDLKAVPLLQRKKLLKSLPGLFSPIVYSKHVAGSGPEFLSEACKLALEGIISKRVNSAYKSTRGSDWLKIKCQRRQEFVIGGYSDARGSRTGFGALLLGVYETNGDLSYVGKVGTGFNEESLATLTRKLEALHQDRPAFANPPKGAEARRSHWVKPELVAEVSFAEWTRDDAIRHSSFQGLRTDKPARRVVREQADHLAEIEMSEAAASTAKPKKTATPRRFADPDIIAGIKLSNPEKALYPEGITKRDLALYYNAIAGWIVPHLEDRPLTLVRCPNGINGECFYQKKLERHAPAVIESVVVEESNGPAQYVLANNPGAIVALVQMGVLEMHTWGSRAPRLNAPDRITFDLDPDEGLDWDKLVEAADVIRTLLEILGFSCFVKTTGGKGLHIVVPIVPELDWETLKGFSRAAAEMLAKAAPERFTAKLPKAQRKGKIYIDYLRNGYNATAIAAYSTRAKPKAPVSVPIAWDELGEEDLRFDYFTIQNVPKRVASLTTDPWADYESTRRAITGEMMRMLGYSIER